MNLLKVNDMLPDFFFKFHQVVKFSKGAYVFGKFLK